jgi:NAD(P)-dependent dehydrogenase (short-subunit alcohol dehydrogenase family)
MEGSSMGRTAETRTAIVTGAASGMGRATAELLTERGWTVLALDRTEISFTVGDATVSTVTVDITDRAAVHAALDAHLGGGAVHLVANIAGVYPPSTLADYTEHLFRTVFDVNVLGTLNVTAAAAPHMSDGAAVVNFASVDAFTVSPGQLLYGASKAAVVMLTKELALELAPRGIRVNAIAPGWVDTPGNAATGRMAAAAASIPLRRVASPREIAEWVALLAGSTAGFMTGETVVLSGGDVIR